MFASSDEQIIRLPNGSRSVGRKELPDRANGIVRAWVTVDGRTELVLEYEDVKFHQIASNGIL